MMFSKKIKIEAVTNSKFAHELFPIEYAKDIMPSWYSKMPNTIESGPADVDTLANKTATIKSCYGIAAQLKTGFIIPAWADMSYIVYPDGTLSWASGNNTAGMNVHHKKQYPGIFNDYIITKMLSPWFIHCDEEIYFHVSPTVYHNDLGIENFMPTGLIDFKYQHQTNVFLGFKPKEKPYEIRISAGQPLMHLIPLTERKVELSVRCDENYQPKLKPFFLHGYSRYKFFKKKQEKKSSCPFSKLFR